MIFSLAKSELRAEIIVASCTRMDCPIPIDSTCHVTSTTLPLFPQAGRPKPQRQDRLTGGTGLYMNYSIILTEIISFYPETSILLQII